MNEKKIFNRQDIGLYAAYRQSQKLLMRDMTMDAAGIIMVKKGHKILRWQSHKYRLDEGNIIAVCDGANFDIINMPCEQDKLYQAELLCFPAALIAAYQPMNAKAETISHAAPIHVLPETFAISFDHAMTAIKNPDLVPDLVATSRMVEMLAWLDTLGYFFAPQNKPPLKQKIRKLIGKDLAKKWQSADVAAFCAMSEATLRRKLQHEGTSLSALLLDMRMCHALTLLQVSDKAILEIAFEVGYENASKFAARFKERFGFLPSEVRNAAG